MSTSSPLTKGIGVRGWEKGIRRMKKRRGQAHRKLVVIGASAGGVETLAKFFEYFEPNIGAAFIVVLHVMPKAPSYMAEVLGRAGRLPAQQAEDGQVIKSGKIYIAPPDYHVLIEDGLMRLSHGPRENRHRPAIDPLFRTAAEVHNSRVIGILLTGTLDDGTMGLKAVKDAGGVTIVQDPNDAIFPDMPRNALQIVEPDFVLPVEKIRAVLPRLIERPAKEKVMKRFKDKGMKPEDKRIKSGLRIDKEMGPPSMFVCPDCNGPLWEMRNGNATLFRCMVGHSFGPENLVAAQTDEVERALWIALRALEERIALQQKLAQRADTQSRNFSSRHFLNRARENGKHAAVLRKILQQFK